MAGKTLTKRLKDGYPYLKTESGLPVWVLPERSFNGIADQVGEDSLLRLAQPLQLMGDEGNFRDKAPGLAALSPEDWQNVMISWAPLPQFKAVVEAFLETADMVMAHFPALRPKFSPRLVSRNLAVLIYTPFVSQGKALIADLAGILDGDASKPEELIKSYAQAVVTDDIETLERVNRCIVRYGHWSRWADAIDKQVSKCRYMPSLIAITPALSAELATVLMLMMKEGYDES